MGNNFEQYEALLGSASETTEACLNTEGGAFLLAWVGELIQNLVAENCGQSARLTIQKLCEAIGANWTGTDCDKLECVKKRVWLNLFAEALINYTMFFDNGRLITVWTPRS